MFEDIDIENANVLQFLVKFLLKKFDDPDTQKGYIQLRVNELEKSAEIAASKAQVDALQEQQLKQQENAAKQDAEKEQRNKSMQDEVLSLLVSGNSTAAQASPPPAKPASSKKSSKKTPNPSPEPSPPPVSNPPPLAPNVIPLDTGSVTDALAAPEAPNQPRDSIASETSSTGTTSPFILFSSGVVHAVTTVGAFIGYAATGVDSAKLTAAKVQHAKNFVRRIKEKGHQKIVIETELKAAVADLQNEVELEFRELVETHRQHGGESGKFEELLVLFKNATSILSKDADFLKMTAKILQYDLELNTAKDMSNMKRAGKEFTSKMFRILVLLEVNAMAEKTLTIPVQSDMVNELKRAINKQFKNNERSEDDLQEDLLVNVRALLYQIEKLIKFQQPSIVASVANTLRPKLSNSSAASEFLTNIKDIISRYELMYNFDAKTNISATKLSMVKG